MEVSLTSTKSTREIEAWEAEMGAPSFWDNSERAQKHIGKLNTLKRRILPVVAFQKKVDDVDVMFELVGDRFGGRSGRLHQGSWRPQVRAWAAELDELEIASFLTGQFDRNNAIFSIQSGAGGTEANDWADILFRMY